ncbi:MAG TPA: hypothetical protein VF963_06735 [Gaiellaceae bacterium]
MRARRTRLFRFASLACLCVAVGVIPAAGALTSGEPAKGLLEHVSQAVVVHQWIAHPEQAPPQFAAAASRIATPPGRHVGSCTSNANKDVYNCDVFGLPQNEESVTACPTNDNLVLGGTNDYRGLIDPEGNLTGWHWSIDGGHSIKNEGLLPPVRLISNPNHTVPSGGDPVDFIQAPCQFVYAASLAYNPANPFGSANGVAVYRSDPATLSTCDTSVPSNPACWPTRRLVAESDASHFLDKEWLFVGGGFVWVTYSDFNFNPAEIGEHPFEASIKAVRCTLDLVTCTQPINISTVDLDVQFSDVTVGPDGRAYITWSRIDGELEGTDQTFTHKIRIETAPGSGVFGPEKVIYAETNAIPFGGFLQGNDFRIATYPKSDVVNVNGHPRIFVIWDACKVRLLGFNCIEPLIKLSYSDDDGATWVAPIVLSNGGINYFPTISADRTGTTNNVAAAWFTNAYDIQFESEQDAVATSINPLNGQSRGLKRLTSSSNEPGADPLLGGFFIGDYIEGVLIKNRYYVHINANYRKVPLLGVFGEPFSTAPAQNQQDNYLEITALN